MIIPLLPDLALFLDIKFSSRCSPHRLLMPVHLSCRCSILKNTFDVLNKKLRVTQWSTPLFLHFSIVPDFIRSQVDPNFFLVSNQMYWISALLRKKRSSPLSMLTLTTAVPNYLYSNPNRGARS